MASGTQITAGKRSGISAFILLVVIVCIAGGILVLRRPPVQRPVLVGKAGATPTSIRLWKGVWYWLEHYPRQDRLVRSSSSGVQVIATADVIDSYDLDDTQIVTIQRRNNQWTVESCPLVGGAQHPLPAGLNYQPFGVAIVAGRVCWLRRRPASIPDGQPFPALSALLELCHPADPPGQLSGFMPDAAVVARIPEAEDGRILGGHDGAIYVAAYRHLTPGCMSIYRIIPGGGPPTRIVGSAANPPALLTRSGTLYWLAPSAETSGAYCLHSLDGQGHSETLSDWLPASGALYETAQGVVYGDREVRPALWMSGSQDRYPTAITVPDGYFALAGGDHELLVNSADTSIGAPTLYRMPLP